MKSSNKVMTNLLWRFAERCGAQGVTFIVSIVLARLLDPAVYGTVALITVFTSILQTFVDSGFGTALVQKKNADDLDFSSVFFFNVAMCLATYLLLFFCAPLIAKFYKDMSLVPLIRVASLIVVISGIKNIQQAYVSRNLLFKRFFFATLGGTIGAAVIGIIMAFKGLGVWALVTQMLFNAFTDTTILWITVKWRPKLMFSFERLRELFSYGWKLLVSGLLNTIYTNIRSLVIGRIYSKEDLAYFNKGNQFPNLIVSNVNSSIDSVLLPVLASEQDNRERVRDMTRRAIKTSCYIMMPLMAGLAACSEPLVRFILTEKWLPCVPFLRIYCFTYAFYPIHTANLNAIKAMGRSDMFLKLEIVKSLFGLGVLLCAMPYGVLAIAYSLLLSCIASQIINAFPNRKLLNYSYLNQLKDILPSILLALVMSLPVYLVQYIAVPDIVTLILQVAIGVPVYIWGSKLLHIEEFYTLLKLIQSFLARDSSRENTN